MFFSLRGGASHHLHTPSLALLRTKSCFFCVVFLCWLASSTTFAQSQFSQAEAIPQTNRTAIQEQQATLIVGSEQEFPPFATGMTDDTAGGFTVELWKAVAAELGLKYHIRVLPFHQLVQEFKAGKINVLINLAQTDERHKWADFTVPHVVVNGAIFVRKHQTGIVVEDDLADKSIIVLNADQAQDYAQSKGWTTGLVLVDNASEGLRLLASGKHDAMLLSKLAGIQTLKTSGLTNVEATKAKAGFSQKFAFATHHGSSGLLEKLNEGLALVKANGTYNTLYEKWFGVYEVKTVGWRDLLKYLVPILTVCLSIGGYVFYRWQVKRNQLLAAIAESHKFLLMVIDSTPTRIFWKDRDLRYLGCNMVFARDAGVAHPKDLIGKDDYQMGWASHAELYRSDDRAVMASGVGKLSYDEQQTTPTGQAIWLRTSKVPLRNANNEIIGLLGAYDDITERKHVEEKLRQMSMAVEQSPASVVITDLDANILYVNPSFSEVTGYSAAEAIGQNPRILQSNLTPQAIHSELWERLSNGMAWHGEIINKRKNGEIYWEESHVSPVRNASGAVTHYVAVKTDVTKRKQAEAALRESEMRFRTLIDQNYAIILQIDPDTGQILEANAAATSFYGWSHDELCAMAIQDINALNSEQVALERHAATKEQRNYFVFPHRLANGEIRTVEVHSTPVTTKDRVTLISIIHDITRRTIAEEKITELVRQQQAMLHSDLVGIVTVRNRIIVWANPAFEKMLGYASGEVTGILTQQTFTSHTSYLEFGAAAYPVLAAGGVYRSRTEHARKDGRHIWVEISGTMLDSQHDESLWSFTDVTESQRANNALRESENRFHVMADSAPVLIWMSGVDKLCNWFNKVWLDFTGRTLEQELGNGWTDGIHPDDLARCLTTYSTAFDAQRAFSMEYRLRRINGEYRWLVVHGVPRHDKLGEFLGYIGSCFDISVRKLAEEELKQSEAKISGILESASDGIFITNQLGQFRYANLAAGQLLGYSRDELLSMQIEDITPPKYLQAMRAMFETLVSTGSMRCELRPLGKDGKVTPVDFNGTVLPDGSVFASCRDITERRRIEDELLESELHLKTIFENEPECIKIVGEQGQLLQMNPAGLAMVEADTAEQVIGKQVTEVIAPEHRLAFAEMHQKVISGETVTMEFELLGLKGGRRWVETHAVPMQDHGQTVHLAVTRDITQRRRMEEHVRQLAFHDALTNLPNRRLLLDRLTQAMVASKRSGRYGALMFMDLDNFKPLNDAHGHETGDLLLIEVAERLRGCVREIDTVARFGGDEFVVMLSDLNADRDLSIAQVQLIAEKVRLSVAKPYEFQVKQVDAPNPVVHHHCTVSIGVALFLDHRNSRDEVLALADHAMYAAKKDGGNVVRFHQDSALETAALVTESIE
jgi:diguanylate cyclase (GGDEF)-like protein/PAS domain S-box-containing protein